MKITIILFVSCYISWTPIFTLQAIQHQPNQNSNFLPHGENIIRQRYKINYIITNYLYSRSTLITLVRKQMKAKEMLLTLSLLL